MPTIKLKRNAVSGTSPTTGQLVAGELALNTEDAYLYAENNAGTAVNRIGTTSDRVKYLAAGAGAVPTTVQAKLRESVSVKDFGAVGNGVADDTDALQAALIATRANDGASVRLYWNKGTYKITNQLILGTNQHVNFDSGVIINLQPLTNLETTSCFVAANQTNVILEGNGATINGTRTGAVTEGNGAGFFLYGSDNILIRNFNINDMVTDGITVTGDVTGSGPCTNTVLANIVVSNCRRNGLSIIHADGCTVLGGEYKNSNGAPSGPYAGIDVEPNADQWARNISIIGVYTESNVGGGLLFVSGAQGNVTNSEFTVTVVGGMSYHDGNLADGPALRFASGTSANKVNGFVSVQDYLIKEPFSCGMRLDNWDADTAPIAILNNIQVVNPDYTANVFTNGGRSGFFLDAATTQIKTNLGNAKFSNCKTIDTRVTPRAISCFWMQSSTGKKVKNVDIINPELINGSSSLPLDVQAQCLIAGAGGGEGITVSYTTPKKFQLNGSLGDLGKAVGQIIEATTAINLTLPPSANCVGSTYRIQTASGVNSVSVILSGSDTIPGYIPFSGSVLVLNEGAYLELTSLGGTAWKVVAITGKYWITGGSAPRRQIWAAGTPTGGTWERGDRAFNNNPAVGSPKGWICTVAGTPGTWVSEGNL